VHLAHGEESRTRHSCLSAKAGFMPAFLFARRARKKKNACTGQAF
jgi:hypothetical protein